MGQSDKPLKGAVIIYFVNYLTNLLINFDHGIIPACTREMKVDLDLDDFQLGMLGSVVYAGLVFGSVVASYCFSYYKTCRIVYLSVIGCMCSLVLFLITKQIYLLFLSRFLVGFFQIFLVVFFPVWVDFFGGKSKTLWLTFMQLGVAFGAVAGYFVTSLFIQKMGNWTYPYAAQVVMMGPCALFYICVPDYMLDTSGRKQNDIVDPEFTQYSSFQRLRILMSNRIFSYTMLGLSTLFFVVNGMQFWVSDYFRNVLNVPQPIVFKAYMLVSLSAPITGVAIGGIVMHYSGGYDGEKALQLSTIGALCASLCGTPIPFLDNFTITLIMLWLLLFFGGSVVPGVTGIMISSIPAHTRSYGNSISHVFQELLGYLPSPMLYGLVVQLTGGENSRWGMILLVAWSYTGLLYLFLAYRYDKWLKRVIDTSTPPVEIELPQKSQNFNVEFPYEPNRGSFFNELRHNTSMSAAVSVAQRLSLDQSFLTTNNAFLGKSLKRQTSLMQTMTVVAGMMGRASIDVGIKVDIEEDNKMQLLPIL